MENQKENAVVVSKPEESLALTAVGQEIKMFELLQRRAKMYSMSTLVPQQYQNNVGNVCIALDLAKRMSADPLMVMQNLYVVHGNPSWSSKFLIATVNTCGRYSPLEYEFKGQEGTDSWACRAFTYSVLDTKRQRPLYGPWVSMAMAKSEGWSNKNGSKWNTMPELMLHYRAAAFWQRTHAPELSCGFRTVEEEREIEEAEAVEIRGSGNAASKPVFDIDEEVLPPGPDVPSDAPFGDKEEFPI